LASVGRRRAPRISTGRLPPRVGDLAQVGEDAAQLRHPAHAEVSGPLGLDKLLEDALIKLSVVVSDPFGASGRAIMASLIAVERDPAVLAELALGRLRSKTTRLTEALTGRFTEHHAFLLTQMLRIDGVSADIATVQARIDAQLGGLAPAVARLDAIPGIGPVAAQMILAEIGTDMGRFPTPAHLTSWARFAPGVSESAGRKKGNAGTGNGNRYLARVVGEAAVSAGHTDTFLGERYRRIARRRGKKRAIVAIGRSILVIVWALLSDEQAQFVDLGPDYYASRTNPERRVRHHVRELQALGYTVTLNPAA
jgi:transposase